MITITAFVNDCRQLKWMTARHQMTTVTKMLKLLRYKQTQPSEALKTWRHVLHGPRLSVVYRSSGTWL